MKFADDESKQYAYNIYCKVYFMNRYLKDYIDADNWDKRLIITNKAIEHYNKITQGDFKDLPPLPANFNLIEFNGNYNKVTASDKKAWIIYELMLLLCSYCENIIKGNNPYLPKSLRYYICEMYTAEHKNSEVGVPAEFIKDYENKLLRLPNDRR